MGFGPLCYYTFNGIKALIIFAIALGFLCAGYKAL
jgi:hypothetical protein